MIFNRHSTEHLCPMEDHPLSCKKFIMQAITHYHQFEYSIFPFFESNDQSALWLNNV